MLSLAIVSLSACSAAISSSTGATILHGPHHSAQKSTSTGLSLPRTSLAKLASVTVTVLLPAMRCSLSLRVCPPMRTGGEMDLCPTATLQVPVASRREVPGQAGSFLSPCSALVEGLGEPALGVDRRGGTGAGRRDGLPVDVVDDVATGEDAVHAGAGGRVVHHHVALVVQLQLAGEQLAARIVTDL